MRHDRSFVADGIHDAGRRPWSVRLGAALAASALVLAACGGPGGGPGGASPAPGGSPATTPGAGTSPAATADTGATPGGDAGGYPERNITFVVPFSAGGPTDTVTRLISGPMGADLGVQITVMNVEGAGGTVAAGQVSQEEPDGYTVLMHHIGMSTAPTLYPDLPYDPLEDFETIGLVTEVPMTIIGAPDFPPETLQELVDYVTENVDTVTYANAGVGAASHLCGLLIEDALGVDLTEASYDGTGPAMTDLLGGHVDFMCDQTTNTTEQILAGEVKGYAVTTSETVESLPDLPTTADGGMPDVQVSVWHGLYVPAGTPENVVQRLTQSLQAALQEQEVIDRLGDLGAAPVSQDRATPEAHTQLLQEQTELWRPFLEAPASPSP
jgi:tripartite-type tricarboxylate transporter receptor subunit TctC